ncbi:dolichyl-phosphate-mannose-protein mannosyltransferase [Bacteriovorax sp. BSW11_IV]|uniref:ArnT family glycosyltransferase n=1 Tax=Bacteriovorax sp. BSW11_IV TaxID=1353529 RepID=UPI000389F7ED|nr:glycosyltransferase family 39 protein [Bacteriovorax sp. BSW11_IV]EQC50015.1 dolichyl-phosphate-mannose-protein mannosyltransferase [Bacteriovorax sp. BSW11_IV]
MSQSRNLLFTLFAILIIIIFYFIDLGNINGLRQGTEGFYLQIAKEMFNAKSFMTPLYMGAEHWSKPPLHFWMAMPFYAIDGEPSLFMSRLSVLLLTFFSIFGFSLWVKRNFNASFLTTFLFFLSTFCFFKYGRIYMMEIPLACLTALGSLYFLDYINTQSKRYLVLAALFTGLSILVKGPVSLVMAVGGSFLYQIYLYYTRKKIILKEGIYWTLLSLLIGSIWFIACYTKYGSEFFNYFFLRENVGKFTAQSYPIRHVFQGLIIYALPWSFFIPFIYYFFLDRKDINRSEIVNDNFMFVFLNFFFFFVLWLIPSQRSHHYAVPSIPFFLILIYKSSFLVDLAPRRRQLFNFLCYLISIFLLVLVFFLAVSLTLKDIHSNTYHLISILFAMGSCIVGALFFANKSANIYKFFCAALVFGSFWTILIPSFTLPLVPGKVIDVVGNNKIVSTVHKPYFVSESFNRDVEAVPRDKLSSYMAYNHTYAITYKSNFDELALGQHTVIIEEWKVWKRRRTLAHIMDALKQGNIDSLKEPMVLIKNTDYNP